jgi:hypothetical protein
VPFVHEGLAAGEAVMVAVIESRGRWLRGALGASAAQVRFVDMAELGANPARIIPAWRSFLDEHADSRQVRGIGEPIWDGRRPEEILECQLHEALLNVAVPPDIPFWLLCPFDAERLDDAVIEEVYRSHPAVVADRQYRGSHLYGGRDHVETIWGSELPSIDAIPDELRFDRTNVHEVSSFVASRAYSAQVSVDRAASLAVVVAQLATSSLQRGSDGGIVRCWTRSEAVVCEVHDASTIADPMVGRRTPTKGQRHPLWNAGEESDLLQVRSTASGTTVRVHLWL